MPTRLLRARYAIIGGVLLAIAAAWLVTALRHQPPAGLDLSRSKASEGGLYNVSVEPEAGPAAIGPLHSWIAAVETADGLPAVDAAIAIDGGMPDHGHGLPSAPKASHVGEGHYLIEGVRFNMGGRWEFHLKISGPAGEDEVTFNIVL